MVAGSGVAVAGSDCSPLGLSVPGLDPACAQAATSRASTRGETRRKYRQGLMVMPSLSHEGSDIATRLGDLAPGWWSGYSCGTAPALHRLRHSSAGLSAAAPVAVFSWCR